MQKILDYVLLFVTDYRYWHIFIITDNIKCRGSQNHSKKNTILSNFQTCKMRKRTNNTEKHLLT